jgi:hypothetical protein
LGENNRALQMKSIADRKVPKFRKAFTPGKFPEGHRALAIWKMKIRKGARRERPNWGLALLMRPAEAAAAVSF